jgi:hypothetical protein
MEDYKDFYDLKDTSDEALRGLFIGRYYKIQFNSPIADDIILDPDDMNKVSTHEERMDLIRKKQGIGYIIKSIAEKDDENKRLSKFAKNELSRLKPDDRYLLPIIERYRKICKEFIIHKKEQESKFILRGIDIEKLVHALQNVNFFEKQYYELICKWFNGIPPSNPIPINVDARVFISLIADICDIRPKLICNTKKFVCSYVKDSYLFKGKKKTYYYIEKIMRPTGDGRVSHKGKSIPDIQQFKY